MAKTFRDGDTVIRLDKILAAHIPNPGDKKVEIVLNNSVKFLFLCKTPEDAKEFLNSIQKELEVSE